ncbi:preprotein translocase subunit YajC [Streptomyces sp. NPDC058001]|uniref:preprotein translocase subunit YajC n=1 Tax=Streptomyces sp. NPDC058001 TaxID=3346300 RepID=UPI0036EC6B58
MSLVTLLPFIVLIGAMFLMTRSAKRKQQQAGQMRDQMQPGSGVRTIGGMYATVKEVSDETVLVEAAPGVHLIFAKNAIGAVLEDDEYNRLVHGTTEDLDVDGTLVPDDASSLTESDEHADAAADRDDDARIDFDKKDDAPAEAAEATAAEKATASDEADADEKADADKTADKPVADKAEPKKTDGESDAK